MVWEVYNTLCVSCDESDVWGTSSHFCSYMDCLFSLGSDVALIIGQTRATAENSLNKDLCMFQFTLSNWRNDFLISVIHSSEFKLWICMKHCSVDKYMLCTLMFVRSRSFCDFELFFYKWRYRRISQVAINTLRLRIGEP